MLAPFPSIIVMNVFLKLIVEFHRAMCASRDGLESVAQHATFRNAMIVKKTEAET